MFIHRFITFKRIELESPSFFYFSGLDPNFNGLKTRLIPKKVELLIRLFEPFWILRVFHFSSRTFEEVEHLKIDISGSNETMQNVLASIV